MKQYELWWANLPEPAGRRPVLPLSRDDAYEYLNKFVAIEVSTKIRSIAMEVPLGKAEGFSSPAWRTATNIRTVSRSALATRIGRLATHRRSEVKRAIGYAFDGDELFAC